MNAQLRPVTTGPRYYLGGGNAAGILGVSPYKSPLDEYLVITAANEEISPQQSAFFKRRKALEPFAAEVFGQVTGLHITARNTRYVDSDHAFIRAEIDFETSDGGNGETKTVHPLAAQDWGDSGSDEIPVYVTAQAMHGLMVTGRPHVWIHALVGLDDDRIYRIERDDELIAGIRAREVAFWIEHILPLVPPEPMTVGDLRLLYPRDSGRVIDVASEDPIAQDVERWRAAKTVLKVTEAECDEIEKRLKLFLRDATLLTIDGKSALTWKAQNDTRFDQRAFAASHPDLIEAFKSTKTIRVLRQKK